MVNIKTLYILAIIVVAILLYLSYSILTYIPPEYNDCEIGDEDCLSDIISSRDECIPSVSVVTIGDAHENITMRITIKKEGEDCIIIEEVIADSNSGIAPYNLTGYNSTCVLDPETIEKYGALACDDSLLGFVGGGGTNRRGGGEYGDPGPKTLYCNVFDSICKETVKQYVRNCELSYVIFDEEINHSINGSSYWTVDLNITKDDDYCILYHTLINAVNLPPEIPPHLIGMNMTCNIPHFKFPIQWISIRWCEGGLVDYIKLIYP